MVSKKEANGTVDFQDNSLQCYNKHHVQTHSYYNVSGTPSTADVDFLEWASGSSLFETKIRL